MALGELTEYDVRVISRAVECSVLSPDIETSPEAPKPSQIPPSPASGIHLSNDSRIFPVRLSISSPSQPELPSPNTEYMGWEASLRVNVTDAKINGEGSQSKWG
jgi:hypothetical protein